MPRTLACCLSFCLSFFLSGAGVARAQTPADSQAMTAYRTLHAFKLDGGSAKVSNLVFQRDRAEMTFTGTFYFASPVLGAVPGAVFIGQGRFRAQPPDSVFERENLRRVLSADVVESDFQTAVLRFTGDAYQVLGAGALTSGNAPAAAQDLASNFEARMLKETGANVASRLLLALREQEEPGVFVAQFDGGRRGRFTFLMDHQCRIPAANFSINGGEKGLIYYFEPKFLTRTIWLAFYALEDYQRETVTYADRFELVDTPAYRLKVDLRESSLKVAGEIDVVARTAGLSTLPFSLTETLGVYDDLRLRKSMKLKAARVKNSPIEFIQEDWEGGFTLLLPDALEKDGALTFEFETEGKYLYNEIDTFNCHFPLNNSDWYPRHGALARSTYDITYLHPRKYKIASVGVRLKDSAPTDDRDAVETVYQMAQPVALATFAMGPYQEHTETVTVPGGEIPLEFFSLKNLRLREDFMMAEIGNALNYFVSLFGSYPYERFRAAFHPFPFGQGFPSMLVVPNTDVAVKSTYLFISHETSHQWWGNVVGWRSYHDQWLSEGFAEYSGILYTAKRDKPSAARELIVARRDSLKEAPRTVTGMGGGRITDIGPLVLGHRLSTVKSLDAYQRLIYNKGALVLRMLHFLLTDPSSGDDQRFFDTMKDFASRYRNRSATSEEFMAVAGEHFGGSPMARALGSNDLGWFFRQWVSQTELPAYRLDYTVENGPGGQSILKGTIVQEHAPEDWLMPIPVVFKVGGKTERAIVIARGSRQPVTLTLPGRPESVELDPDLWVLSEKTSARKQ